MQRAMQLAMIAWILGLAPLHSFASSHRSTSGSQCHSPVLLQSGVDSKRSLALSEANECVDAVEGDSCHFAVTWAKNEGIYQNPEWYPGLTASSSFAAFQCVLHAIEADGGVCQKPCSDCGDQSTPTDLSKYQLLWQDEFEGPLDEDTWIVGSLRDPRSGDLVPGAVGENLLNWDYCAYITREDTYTENGSLVLRGQRRSYTGSSPAGDFQYTTGHVMTMHRIFLNKGYVEFRAKWPCGTKTWPALWLIAEDLTWGPEWDMWEYFGDRPDVGYDVMGMHLASQEWPNIRWHSSWIHSYSEHYDCSEWHIFGFEWTDSSAKWSIDGKLVHTLLRDATMQWPDEDMYLVLNNGAKTSSADEDTSWPNFLVIDYVRIYQVTPGLSTASPTMPTFSPPSTTTITTSTASTTKNEVWIPWGQACRGVDSSDNSASNYLLYTGVGTLDDCKHKCEEASCQGIEYHPRGRCEVWTSAIQASRDVPGYTCFRFWRGDVGVLRAVDGGVDRACRGSDSSDNLRRYYELHSGVTTLDECKVLCASTPTCQGLEHNAQLGRCEVWTRAEGIEASRVAPGFTCFRYENPN
eukprot:TRINITY_DN20237_c0_g1_i1.p1 TRINITY_DN20237_c0_g1~~TRINITY_DN20237_c0_g1_i1.p1  ORF type:complete len:578 (-),score=55.32 TRINITY_DN20237_c0_g1_i1:126-1859(-)